MLYKQGVIAAVKRYGARYFQTGPVDARIAILAQLGGEIAGLYGRTVPTVHLRSVRPDGMRRDALGSASVEGIDLYGKLSLVTFLHELYHWLTLGSSVGSDELVARQWSVSLLVRAIPAQAGKCTIAMGDVRLQPRRNRPGNRVRRALRSSVAQGGEVQQTEAAV